jgi:Uma2 family endonuclease
MSDVLAEKELYTYDNYLKAGDEVFEIIEGEKKEMTPAPNFEHQDVQAAIVRKLITYIFDNKMGKLLFAPTDVILDNENVVQPDILFLSNEKKELIEKRGIFGSPDLVIEIISPSSKYRDTFVKKDLYEKFGVKEYWLVDYYMKNIEILCLDENNKYQLYSEGSLEERENTELKVVIKSKVLNELEIDLEEIFNKDTY